MKNEINSLLIKGNTSIIGKKFGIAAIPELKKYIKHKDINLRKNAIEAFGYIGDSQAAEPLIEVIYREEEESLYPTIAETLEKLGDLGLEPVLLELSKPKHKAGNRQKFQEVLLLIETDVLKKAINSVKIVSPGNALYMELATRLFVKSIPDYTSYDKKLKYQENKEEIKAMMAVAFKDKTNTGLITNALQICKQFPRVGRFNWQQLIDTINGKNEELATMAIRILGEIKAKKTVPDIEKKLETKSFLKVRLQAAKTLGEMKAKDAVASLIDTMEKDPNGDVQLEAIISLGKIGKAAAPQLVDKLIRDENVDKVENALKRVGPPAVPYLARAIEDPNDKIRKNAIELAQLILTTKYGQAGTVAKLIELLGDKSNQVQEAVTETIVKMGDPGIEQLIIATRDPPVRARAVQILEEFGTYNLEIVLNRFRKTNAPRFLELSILTYVFLTDDEILDMVYGKVEEFVNEGKLEDSMIHHIANNVLEDAFTSDDIDTIYNAAQVARYFGAIALQLLIPLLSTKDPDLQVVAIESFGVLGETLEVIDEEALSSLAKALDHKDDNVRIAAAEALGKIRSTDSLVLTGLVQRLKDPNEEVSSECFNALVNSGQPAAEKAITIGMANPSLHEKTSELLKKMDMQAYPIIAANIGNRDDNIRDGLTTASIKIAENDPAIANSLRGVFVSSLPEVHSHVIEILGILRDEKAVSKMIQSYLVHQKKVMSEVIRAFNNIGQVAIDELMKALVTPDSNVQKRVMDLLKDLNNNLIIPALIDGLNDPQAEPVSSEALKKLGEKKIINYIANVPGGDLIKAKECAEILMNNSKLQKIGQKAMDRIPR
ncbi:MAG: HEAT repeat domain-containing protein [Candidatus Hodarchaeales archaeon]|jgi:HEAT repeat protein